MALRRTLVHKRNKYTVFFDDGVETNMKDVARVIEKCNFPEAIFFKGSSKVHINFLSKLESALERYLRVPDHSCIAIKDPLSTFLDLKEVELPKLSIEIYLKLKNVGSAPKPASYPRKNNSFYRRPSLKSHIQTLAKYNFTDLDFGLADKIIRHFRVREAGKALKGEESFNLVDVGCGRQVFLGWHLPKTVSYTGIDPKLPEIVYQNLTLKKDVAENLSNICKKESTDFITVLALIEHLSNPEKFIRDCYKTLKKGGILIITSPPPTSKPILKTLARIKIINKEEIDQHKAYFTKKTLKSLLIKSGYQKVDAKPFCLGLNSIYTAQK